MKQRVFIFCHFFCPLPVFSKVEFVTVSAIRLPGQKQNLPDYPQKGKSVHFGPLRGSSAALAFYSTAPSDLSNAVP